MRHVEYEVASPDNTDPVDVILMPNILGGALDAYGQAEGDHLYRARFIANELMSHVIAYERPGTGRAVLDLGAHSSVQPSNYVRAATSRAAELQKAVDNLGTRQTIILGASSGGTDAIAIAQTEMLDLDAVAVYDPIGVRETTWSGGFIDWLSHQKLESRRPIQLRNQHPMDSPGQPLATYQAISGLARTAVEMVHYGNAWRHETAYQGLSQLVRDGRYGHIALLGQFPVCSFTDVSSNMEQIVRELEQSAIDSGRPAAAEFAVVNAYHSWTDDPANLAEIGRRAQALTA